MKRIERNEKIAKNFTWELVDSETGMARIDEHSSFAEETMRHAGYLEKMFEDWGQRVERYRTDIYYDVVGMVENARELDDKDNDELSLDNVEYPLRLIGIRPCGVDGTEFIDCRLKGWEKEYINVYKTTISRRTEYTGTTIYTFKLYRAVKPSESQKKAEKK